MQNYSRTSLGAAISFLVQEGKAQVLSKPRLACLSGKDAELMVGGQVPTITTGVVSGGGSSNSVSYQDYGIKFKFSPKVHDDGKIEINLNTEVSDVGQSLTLGSLSNPTAIAYPLTKRSTSTTVLLDDLQTMSISGLITQKTDESLTKFPWLSDIPVLGAFFRNKTLNKGGGSGARGDMELVIMLTPHLIKSEKAKEDADYAAKVQALPLNARLVNNKYSYQAEVIGYTKEVRDRIVSALAYPYDAQEAGWQANVTVKLHLASDGSLIEAQMAQASGYKIFDEAVMKTIRETAKYPSFPSDIDAKDLWLEVPIVYQMK
jgi:TonB family protein